jgi:hypothetical protein
MIDTMFSSISTRVLGVSLLSAAAMLGQVAIKLEGTTAHVSLGGKPFTSFYAAGANKPYLHPLRTASGKVITRNFPMADVAGETRDHEHHRGLWFTHGDVNGWDFWANEPNQKGVGKGIGKVILAGPVRVKGDTILATFEWVDGQGTKLLRETRTMKFAAGQVIDFDFTLTALVPVKFGDTKEGTFALRLRDELTEKKGTAKLRSSTGGVGMKNVWGKAAPWVDYSGELEGEPVGVTIFDHPGNPRHPTTWHARDYGLFAANIFGTHDFLNDKSKDGSLTLETGKSIRFRYRLAIHGYDAAAAFAAYANTR